MYKYKQKPINDIPDYILLLGRIIQESDITFSADTVARNINKSWNKEHLFEFMKDIEIINEANEISDQYKPFIKRAFIKKDDSKPLTKDNLKLSNLYIKPEGFYHLKWDYYIYYYDGDEFSDRVYN